MPFLLVPRSLWYEQNAFRETSLYDTFKSVRSLLLSYALLLTGTGLFSTLIAVRADIEQFSVSISGFIMSSYFLGLLLGALYSVRLVIQVGHIRAFAVYASLMSTASIMHVMIVDPYAWMAIRVVTGFCMAGMVLITEAWLNERAANKVRGQVLSLYMGIGYACAGISQFILPLANPAEFFLFGLISIIFSLALVPVLVTRSPSPRPASPERISPLELYRISPVATAGAFIAGAGNSTLYGLGPLFTRQIGLSLESTSTFMASAIIGGLFLQYPVGKLSDRFDRRLILAGTTLATAIAAGAVVLNVSVGNMWQQAANSGNDVLYITAFIYGSLAFTLYSLAAAQANDLTHPDRLMQTAGGLLIAFGIGAIIGPLLAGFIMDHTGPRSLFVYLMCLNLLLFGFVAYRRKTRQPGRIKRFFIPKPETQYSPETLYNAVRNDVDSNPTPPGVVSSATIQEPEEAEKPSI
jgi:MFS family permease